MLRRMVTFRRETRLWRETSVTQRALMIRDDADTYWLACQMQHGRITDPGPAILSDLRSIAVQGRIDVDLFIVTLHRLHAVAKLAAERVKRADLRLMWRERNTQICVTYARLRDTADATRWKTPSATARWKACTSTPIPSPTPASS
jgi:hypothetical protein